MVKKKLGKSLKSSHNYEITAQNQIFKLNDTTMPI